MSKELFFDMRAQEISRMYDSTFSKKEAKKTGEDLVVMALENGEVDIMALGANLVRLQEVVNSAVEKFRSEIKHSEKITTLGVTFTPKDGGYSLSYEEDEIYACLKADLDQRAALLKMAQNQKNEIYDAFGNVIPVVSKIPRKSSVSINF